MSAYWEKLKDPRWQKKRLEVLNRAGFKCENCGAADQCLHVHHGYYAKGADPWDYPEETLWCLCEACHEQAEDARLDVYLELARMNPCKFSPNMIFPLQSREEVERMVRIDPGQAYRLKWYEEAKDG